MSQDGQSVLLGNMDLPAGTWFPWHSHAEHQLVWAPRGVVTVEVGSAHWVLPPTRALWLPGRTWHRTGASGRIRLMGIYADPERCPVSWPEPRLIPVRPVLRELLGHLIKPGLDAEARDRAEQVVFDLLEPMDAVPIIVPMPEDPRALRVAEAVLRDPADRRGLAEFGGEVGASARTLARIFLAQCGMSFGRWRTQARLRACLPWLATGMPLDGVARRAGYSSPSAFVAAFRRAVGVTPGEYFRQPPVSRPASP
ncbi:helix-turn-helix transcriptional regulator [Amycolatopsis acidicola]|uniref:HTH-type transcriptional regulator RipA n=1 Tax=Amycolatopsis acidicola TaxID=2596893 RepID=A0A5N0V9B4_9PSEU|nr:helix-turn-helix transcriptional regulator [Amycolatopsis acidicola]KAA9162098.1 helix-turn-helix transcriptional regulator [Amycolatopsis acidicola]